MYMSWIPQMTQANPGFQISLSNRAPRTRFLVATLGASTSHLHHQF